MNETFKIGQRSFEKLCRHAPECISPSLFFSACDDLLYSGRDHLGDKTRASAAECFIEMVFIHDMERRQTRSKIFPQSERRKPKKGSPFYSESIESAAFQVTRESKENFPSQLEGEISIVALKKEHCAMLLKNHVSYLKVIAFCDVSARKISKAVYIFEESSEKPKPRIPIIHFSSARAPIVICVKMDLMEGGFEDNLASLKLEEGVDYVHFG